MKAGDLRLIVKEKYAEIATLAGGQTRNSCCESITCCPPDMDNYVFSDDYSALDGYNPDADLGLGCGLPVQFAGIKKGDHVLDLGSGAGNDCFVARTQAGETGRITGLDFTDEMLRRAKINLQKTEFTNIEFIKGDIENIPLRDKEVDVVISNCVLNLVPDKHRAFSEIHRVLKPGGCFCISDIVVEGQLPDKLLNVAEMYAGCVSGAIKKQEYLKVISDTGFRNVEIRTEKEIVIPDKILSQYLSTDALGKYRQLKTRILSITLTASK